MADLPVDDSFAYIVVSDSALAMVTGSKNKPKKHSLDEIFSSQARTLEVSAQDVLGSESEEAGGRDHGAGESDAGRRFRRKHFGRRLLEWQ